MIITIFIIAAIVVAAAQIAHYMMLRDMLRIQQARAEARERKKTAVYCGDEDTAAFLISTIGELGIAADCEIVVIDGEYFVEVQI